MKKRILSAFYSVLAFAILIGVILLVHNLVYPDGQDTMDMMLAQMSEQSGTSSSYSSGSSTGSSGMSSTYSGSSRTNNTIGLSAGGAKDIVNFRENIRNDYLPQPTDVTCEGLFYDYYFDTGMTGTCTKLFCPSYATAITRDPVSFETEYYLSVGLNSGLTKDDFQRKKLNLVVVLDISSSMSEELDQYYYDADGRRTYFSDTSIVRKRKIECAKEAIVSILNQLDRQDRFGLVLFNSEARLAMPMRFVDDWNMADIEREIWDITEFGGTNLDSGFEMASGLFRKTNVDRQEYENRIIVLTDAQLNTGDISVSGLWQEVSENADKGVFCTFIGIGVDFNSQLIENISKTKGANYYSVNSADEFNRRIEEEFEFMVTPLVFDLNLRFESKGWRIERVFGSPEADLASGKLMKINTLFPSKSSGRNNKGGLVLLKLRRITSEPDARIYLRVNYEDRSGYHDSSSSLVTFNDRYPDYYQNYGIRKGVLLTRYASLLQNWMDDERRYAGTSGGWQPGIDETTGISGMYTGRSTWERQSMRLRVSKPYSYLFTKFTDYFESEMNAIGDYTLEQELDILRKLARVNG